ncbi:MAG TPA: methyltransferase [Gaiellaceae bacterium]
MADRPDARAMLLRIITGHVRTHCLYVVARLGVVDRIPQGGTAHIDEIAAAVDANSDALYRVLRMLAGEGLFSEVTPHVFAVTDLGELLRDGDGSARYLALMHGGQTMDLFRGMLDSVRTGTPVPMLRYGKTRWELLSEDPDEAEVFNRAMRARAPALAAAALSIPWDGIRTVVDVGGGTGGVLFPLLAAQPHLQATLFDLAQIEGEARATIEAAGLSDRCDFVSGSFFEHVPAGADAYVLSNILHDWDDDACARILATCRAAARAGSRLVVLENLLPPGDDPHPVKTLDMQMLVTLGGRERTEDEYRGLLADAGFELTRITGETPAALEAHPV